MKAKHRIQCKRDNRNWRTDFVV